MPGQVIHDSILGDNKEKTKVYWESRMRHEQLEKEKDKLNGFNKLRSTSTTSAVIHKINEEIEELHRREKELKDASVGGVGAGMKTIVVTTANGNHSANDDEDDVFSSNGSSMDEFEPAESPRLESGFYSNLGEDEQVLPISPDLKGRRSGNESETESQEGDVSAQNKINKEHSAVTEKIKESGISTSKEELDDMGLERAGSVTPRPVVLDSDEAEKTSVFTFQKETPIEKEIRLSRVRDEEYRLRRQSSSVSPASSPAPVSTKSASKSIPVAPTNVKPSAIKESEKRIQLSSSIKEPKRNIQYQLATERLRREILEATMREDELKSRGRIQSASPALESNRIIEENKINEKTIEEIPTPEVTNTDTLETVAAPTPVIEPKESSPKPSQITLKHEKKEHSPIERRFSSVSVESIENDRPSFHRSTSNLLGRPSFNSYQRYLIKTSPTLRIAKNFQLSSPSPVEEEKPASPAIPEPEIEEPQTPRRKLVLATTKIEKELRDMKERERELALIRTRSFKSTPNLFASIDDEDHQEKEEEIEVEETEKNKDIIISKKFERKPIVERKRSALINQWEEKITSNSNVN